MTQEGWVQINQKLLEIMEPYRTTLVFVNNRRLCERLARQLSDLLGQERVARITVLLHTTGAMHRELALKSGSLKVMVATSSLELGIDIGTVDLVVQIASPRSIHGFLQRIGRAEHHKDGVSRAVLVPLTRDDLVECAALLRAIKHGHLEEVEIPEAPLDILAQQIVAEVSCRKMTKDSAFEFARRAFPYRHLTREVFEQILGMLADGYSLRFGRRSRYIFYDRAFDTIEARPGARLSAITNGGAIADNFEYEVILEGEGAFLARCTRTLP
jgi:ATP-dependent Lhr-like helicase